MKIKYLNELKIWVAESQYEEKDALKQAGFWFHFGPESCNQRHSKWGCKACDANLKKVWWTFKKESAVKFLAHCDDNAKVSLQETKKALEESRAADAVDITIPVPANLEYMPFQKAGIRYALSRPGVLIADEMGLGKTIQAIGIINAKEYKSVLIIVPASLRLNWVKELNKWLVAPHSIVMVDSPDVDVSKAEIVVVNYDRIKNGIFTGLMARQWDLLVVDEAHFCKNPAAQRTQRILGYWDKKQKARVEGLINRVGHKVFMTGTPILNRPIEIQPILGALDPKQFGNAFQFGNRYCAGNHNGYGWDFTGASRLEELQDRLRVNFMVRRLKRDVLKELPPKVRNVILLDAGANEEYDEETHNHLIAMEEADADAEVALASGDADAYDKAVSKLDASLKVAFEEMASRRHADAVRKIPAALAHLDELLEGGLEKAVIFAHHHDVIDALYAQYKDVAVLLDGRTPNEDRQAAVDKFQEDPSVKLFIGSIKAAGVGHTLTAASTVIFVELDWVPGMISQAEDRCHRKGQLDSVYVQHLVVDGTLDCRLAQILVRKQEIIDRALDNVVEIVAPETKQKKRVIKVVKKNADGTETEEEFKATEDQRQACAEALQSLAGVCDGARELDMSGFNRFDVRMGHSLAAVSQERDLTDNEVALCVKRLTKYRRQLGEELVARIKGK